MKTWEFTRTTQTNSGPTEKVISQPDRPPFKWAGSKNRMFKKYVLSGFFPNSEPDLFVDMFAGTGCVARWVKKNYPNTNIVLNEACDEIITMYQSLKKANYNAFEKEYLKHVQNGYVAYNKVEDRKKYYYDLRNRYALYPNTFSPIEQGAALMYMLQTGFNGIWQTSENFNFRYASPAGLMTWQPKGSLFETSKIRSYAEFIDSCILMTGDFENTISFFGKGNWFYADPPYRLSFAKYNSAGVFSDTDQARLCDFLNVANTAGCLVTLSNREHLPKGWSPPSGTIKDGWFADKFDDNFNCKYLKVKYTAGRHNHGAGSRSTEVLIKNY